MDKHLKPNVINIHLTDKCNYSCKHCFVNKDGHELDFETACLAVDKINEYLLINKINNGKITLAGGEPLLYKDLYKLIDYINNKHIEVSLISNGTLINENFLKKVKGKIETIGLSIDAINEDINRQIGRCTTKGKCLDLSILSLIPKYGFKLKINVCVSKMNQFEDFDILFKDISISRLKLLQMHCDSHENELTANEFENFCEKLKQYNPIIESSEKMKKSYLIIDSKGMISCSNDHKSNISIKDYSIDESLTLLNFNIKNFNERYKKVHSNTFKTKND